MSAAVARSRVPWWTGLPFTVAAAVGWIALAVNTPTTTYHFAPTVVAAAWPVAMRPRAGHRLSARELAVSTGGGIALASIVTVALTFVGALAGPTFFGTDAAVAETWLMAALGAVIGFLFALRSARAKDDEVPTEFEQTTRSRNA